MGKKFYDMIPYIICIIVIGIIAVFILDGTIIFNKKVKDYDVNIICNSENEFLKSKEIEVNVNEDGDFLYSFDGGNNWQKDNKYNVTTNGELTVYIRNNNGDEFTKKIVISNIDNEGPEIKYIDNKDILKEKEIYTKDLFEVLDAGSGVASTEFKPEKIDTKKSSVIDVEVFATDFLGNKTTVTFSVNVNASTDNTKNKKDDDKKDEIKKDDNEIKQEEQQKQKYYRYRTKVIKNCNSYDCDYVDEVELKKEIVQTGKCDEDYKTSKKTTRDTCLVPTPKTVACGQALTPVYVKNSDGLYYSRIAISTGKLTYKEPPCGEDEVEMGGYCHPMCEKYQYTCPDGYDLKDNSCTKVVKATCYEKCIGYTWSEWSEWSTVKVIPSEDIQVEEKYE